MGYSSIFTQPLHPATKNGWVNILLNMPNMRKAHCAHIQKKSSFKWLKPGENRLQMVITTPQKR